MQTAVQESNMNPNSSRVIIVTINRLPPGYKIPSTYHTSIVVVFPFFLPNGIIISTQHTQYPF